MSNANNNDAENVELLGQLDFSNLTLRDALDLAVEIEEEARDRYQELTDQLLLHHTPEAAGFFRKMVSAEEHHRAQLASRRQALFGDEPRHLPARVSLDVESPDYDDARAFMSVQAALAIALRCERRAHAFFTQAIPRIADPAARALFETLREEEAEHQLRVAAEIARAPTDAGRTEDYSDEPVAQ